MNVHKHGMTEESKKKYMEASKDRWKKRSIYGHREGKSEVRKKIWKWQRKGASREKKYGSREGKRQVRMIIAAAAQWVGKMIKWRGWKMKITEGTFSRIVWTTVITTPLSHCCSATIRTKSQMTNFGIGLVKMYTRKGRFFGRKKKKIKNKNNIGKSN